MKAMILAAGRGERMRPLTDNTPKPLLIVGEYPLIVWHILRLAKAGIRQIVINHAWLGEQIEFLLGDGSRYGVDICYSPENPSLETAGGIANALHLLGDEPFIVVNGDVFTDLDFAALAADSNQLISGKYLAKLLLVNNPEHNQLGDFALLDNGKLASQGSKKLTFSGVGLYHPLLFAKIEVGQKAKLAPILVEAIQQKRICAELHQGLWLDVGTIERLSYVNKIIKQRSINL